MPRAVTFELIAAAANHCWSNKFLERFRDFFADNAHEFIDAPDTMGEQDLGQYAVFQRYLRLYEEHFSTYIESLDVSIEEFFFLLEDIKNDPKVVDKKLLHFVNYLLASTDYAAFYKVMVRAAKKVRKAAEAKGGAADAKSVGSSALYASPDKASADSKAEGKESDDVKSESK